MTESIHRGWGGETLARTGFAVRATLHRTDALFVFVGVTVGYLAAYLFAIGHLTAGSGEFGLLVVSDPLSRAFEPVGSLSWEPVARLDAGVATLLVSPLNLLLGWILATLVGVNLAVTYLAWRQPKACGISGSSGIFAGIPALLSGAACCGPVVLIVLGVQASGILLTAFSALVPLALILLVGSLLWVGRKVNPAAV
ncbi:hypothetical protein [Haladaptatus sp. NG-SE-30]